MENDIVDQSKDQICGLSSTSPSAANPTDCTPRKATLTSKLFSWPLGVTVDSPQLISSNGNVIHVMHDTPHLLKNVRSNLLRNCDMIS